MMGYQNSIFLLTWVHLLIYGRVSLYIYICDIYELVSYFSLVHSQLKFTVPK